MKDHDAGKKNRIGSGNAFCHSVQNVAILLKLFLSYCVGVKFGVLRQEKNTD